MTAEATFAGTLPAIQRTQDHTYLWTDPATGILHRMPGVTTHLDTISKGYALDSWNDKTIAEAAVRLYRTGTMDELTDAMAVAAIREAVKEPRTVAMHLGSEIHGMAEQLHRGETPQGSALAKSYADTYWQWWEASGWRLRLSEAIVIFPSQGYGGTLDLLAYDEDGRTVLADIKTGSVYAQSATLQLTAYGLCPLVSPMGSDTVYPMPKVDRYVILDVKPERVRPIEINIGQAELMAWSDVLDLYQWQQKVHGRL